MCLAFMGAGSGAQMSKTSRDILDHLGNKIGKLELPENTSEEVWAEKLSVYKQKPIISEEKTDWSNYKGGGFFGFNPPEEPCSQKTPKGRSDG